MLSIDTKEYKIFFKNEAYDKLNLYLKNAFHSKIFIIVDSNTRKFCLTKFLEQINKNLIAFDIIEFNAGEVNKNISTCLYIWEQLSRMGADRQSLIINLGGGVVTDLGGFVAGTFKRGIKFINVPTSLLAMVDASIGGKTGVDLGVLKNQIGVILNPEMVLIDTFYLKTLPLEHLKSAWAEMFKHGLIADKNYATGLRKFTVEKIATENFIAKSIQIKHAIVSEDMFENGMRKYLNFGHTAGHAIESYLLKHHSKKQLLHGEAIGIGMVLEAYMSFKTLKLSFEELEFIKQTVLGIFNTINFSYEDKEAIIDLMKHDKKNKSNTVNFVLLNAIGKPQFNCKVPKSCIYEAFDYYIEG